MMSVAQTVKIKVEIHLRSGHEGPEVEERYSSTLCLTYALVEDGWLVLRLGCFTAGKRPGTHCVVGWEGPMSGLDGCGKPCPTAGFNPQTVQPVEHY